MKKKIIIVAAAAGILIAAGILVIGGAFYMGRKTADDRGAAVAGKSVRNGQWLRKRNNPRRDGWFQVPSLRE